MRGMRGVWMCVGVLALLRGDAGAAEQRPMTHSVALDSVAAQVAEDLLRGVTVPAGRPVTLTAPAPGDTLGLLTQQLVERLRSQGAAVRLAPPGGSGLDTAVASINGMSGSTEGRALRLNVQVDGSNVSYVRRLGSFPFGTKGYERLAAMRASATLLDSDTGEVLWTKSSTRTAMDVVPKGDVFYAASGSGRLNPPVPRGGTRWLEPMIVVGVVAGLVVLFYSNRN